MAAENLDLDFRDEIIPPCADFADTLELIYGWNREDAEADIEWSQLAMASIYRHFGGGDPEGTLPFPPTEQELWDYIVERERTGHPPYGLTGREEAIAGIVMRYLTGHGDDYQAMNEI